MAKHRLLPWPELTLWPFGPLRVYTHLRTIERSTGAFFLRDAGLAPRARPGPGGDIGAGTPRKIIFSPRSEPRYTRPSLRRGSLRKRRSSWATASQARS